MPKNLLLQFGELRIPLDNIVAYGKNAVLLSNGAAVPTPPGIDFMLDEIYTQNGLTIKKVCDALPPQQAPNQGPSSQPVEQAPVAAAAAPQAPAANPAPTEVAVKAKP